MAYTIYNNDGSVLLKLPDSEVDGVTTSLSLIGKNVNNYGEYFNNNLVKLLTSFANTAGNEPANPQIGQLFFNKTTGRLTTYNGNSFAPTNGSWLSRPLTPASGDFYFDTSEEQLFIWTGTNYKLVGPTLPRSAGKFGIEPSTATITADVTYAPQPTVGVIYSAGNAMGMVSPTSFKMSTVTSNLYLSTSTATQLLAGLTVFKNLDVKTNIFWPAKPVNPEDYGAVGDGVTNDYVSLKAAIDTGRSVYLTEGKTYYYTTGLFLKTDHQRFGGPGILKPSGSIDGITIGYGTTGIEVDLTFNAPNLAGCAVRVDNANRVTIKKLHGISIGTNNTSSSVLYIQKSNTVVVDWLWAVSGGKGITWYGSPSLRSDILRINFAVLDCNDYQYGLDWDGNCHSLEIGYLGLVGTKGVVIRNTYFNNASTATVYPAIGKFNHIEIDYPSSHGVEILAGLDYDFDIPYVLGAGIRYATVLNTGTSYTILYPGDTTWTSIGSANNNTGTVFTATGPASATTSTGFVKETGTAYSGFKSTSTINSYQVRIHGGKSVGHAGYGIENAGGVLYVDGSTDLSDNRLGRTTGTIWTTVQRLTLDDDNFYLTMNSGNPLIAVGSTSTISYNRAADQLNFTIANVGTIQVDKTYVQTLKPLIIPTYTVATLPSGVQGMRAFVSDSNTSTFYSAVASGGSFMVPVYYTGFAWRIG